jgi:23S rRNA (cytosine1962-C5)-methyltransferase
MRYQSILQEAFRKREKLYDDSATNCFRLFNGDGDGVPGLTMDWYGEYLLVQYFHPGLAGRTDDLLRCIGGSINLLPAPPRGILLKNRNRQPGVPDIAAAMRSSVIEGSAPPGGYSVRQNGVLAAVDLVGGQSTGVFLDMREVRDRLKGFYRPGGVMLNLFCYTALFSVHAVVNGMQSAVNVDLSRGVLARARTNYGLNGLRVDERDFIFGDSLDWMRRFRKKDSIFSLVIFDPPTFSRNRKRTFSTKKNYRDSLALAEGLAGGGLVLSSVNSYSVTQEEYISYHPAGWNIEFFANESSDFAVAGTPYLKVGLWKIKNS